MKQINIGHKIFIVILAAGSSSRMGESKQLLRVNGEPLLLRSSMAALDSGVENVVVVLGANEKAHRNIIQDLPLTIVHNPGWQKGMGNTIKGGLRHVLKMAPDAEAVMVMVCDQPRLTSAHLKNLIQQYRKSKSKIVASYYSHTTGVPALFDKSLFQNLFALEDGQGAKKILGHFQDLTQTVRFDGGEIDLDTLSDYQNFIEKG